MNQSHDDQSEQNTREQIIAPFQVWTTYETLGEISREKKVPKSA